MSEMIHNEPDPKELNKAIRLGKIIPTHDGKYWSDEERYQLQNFFLEGEDISEISRILQRSERAIVQQLSSLKLFEPPSKRNTNRAAKCLCNKCDLNSLCHDCKNK